MSKKKYSISWENEEPVSFEVDGARYDSLDQIPDEADRAQLEAMLDASFEREFEEKFKDFDKEIEKQSEANQKSAGKMEKLVLGIFSGVAALLLMIALLSSYSAVAKMSREASAPGRVVEVVMKREYVNEEDRIISEYYYPVVEFTAGDGRRRAVQMSEGSWPPSHEVGDEVTVRYDPEHPLEARIKSASSDILMWILPGITGLLGLGFLGAVVVVRKVMSPTQPDELA